ncbi:hypothetical protein AM10699_11540 [Acaryochloris marina MBIC10699]|nr:hypothetical protein AM10699_11540 [Acaryochloris marina MBIC10699]
MPWATDAAVPVSKIGSSIMTNIPNKTFNVQPTVHFRTMPKAIWEFTFAKKNTEVVSFLTE